MRKKRKTGCLLFLIVVMAGAVTVCSRGWSLYSWERGRETAAEEASANLEEQGIDLDIRFYYQQLDEEEKSVYRVLSDGIRKGQKKITVTLSDAEQVNSIYQKVQMDFPEYFWCSGTVKTTSYTGAESYSEVSPEYIYSQSEARYREKKIDKTAERILKGISGNMSEYGKIKYIYKYIIDMTDYNPDAEDNQNIYSVLVGKESVCAGYAKSVQYLLNRAGMFCAYVVGTTTQGEYHAWNLVRCGGEYYYVDATWGDPVFVKKAEGVNEDNITYDYLCCSDKELFRTHKTDTAYEYPACTSEKLNYYRLNHMYYTAFDEKEAKQVLKDSIDNREEETIFKYAGEKCYEAAVKGMVEKGLLSEAAKYLCQEYDLNRVNYYYQKDDIMHKITVFWNYSE